LRLCAFASTSLRENLATARFPVTMRYVIGCNLVVLWNLL
jgi:hypothetical protein